MKLHLPTALGLALAACAALSLTLPALGEEIQLTTPVTWEDGSGPGYTGLEGDYYTLSGDASASASWDIGKGSYNINASSGNSALNSVKMSYTNFSLAGELHAQAVSTTDEARGIQAENSTLDNAGTISVSATAKKMSYGISLSDSDFTNEGTIIATASSTSAVHYSEGFYMSGGEVINKGSITATANGGNKAYGLNLLNGTFRNQGDITASASGATNENIAIRVGGKLFNEGSIRADSMGDGRTYLLDGSNAGALTEGSSLEYVSGPLYLGGAYNAEDAYKPTAVAGGSTVTFASGLTVKGSAYLSLSDDTTLAMGGHFNLAEGAVSNTDLNRHTLTIDNGGSAHLVTLGENLTASWTGAARVEALAYGHDRFTLAVEAGNSLSEGSITNRALTLKSMAEGESYTLKGINITLQQQRVSTNPGTASISDAVIEGASCIRTAEDNTTAEVTLHNVTFRLDGDNTSLANEGIATLSEAAVLTLDSSVLGNVSVSGDFTLDLDALAGQLELSDYDALTFNFSGVSFEEGTSVRATWGGTTLSGTAGSDAEGGSIVSFTMPGEAGNVPEPTTSTLGLLALAALAARRRRRG